MNHFPVEHLYLTGHWLADAFERDAVIRREDLSDAELERLCDGASPWCIDYVLSHWEAAGLITTCSLPEHGADGTYHDYSVALTDDDASRLRQNLPTKPVYPGHGSAAPLPSGLKLIEDAT